MLPAIVTIIFAWDFNAGAWPASIMMSLSSSFWGHATHCLTALRFPAASVPIVSAPSLPFSRYQYVVPVSEVHFTLPVLRPVVVRNLASPPVARRATLKSSPDLNATHLELLHRLVGQQKSEFDPPHASPSRRQTLHRPVFAQTYESQQSEFVSHAPVLHGAQLPSDLQSFDPQHGLVDDEHCSPDSPVVQFLQVPVSPAFCLTHDNPVQQSPST
jgi:hypothetical protein